MINNLYIVIVSYNGMKWLKKTIESIPKEYNIVIVDNNSTDDTVKFIKSKYPYIKLLVQKVNLGFGGGNNIGFSYAIKQKAKYVFLLNQDAYLQIDTISKLLEIYKKNKEYGILSPIHLNGNKTKLDKNFLRYIGHDRNPSLYLDAFNKTLKPVYDFSFINAAAWLIPIEVIENVGGFDTVFFHYGEDDNFCHRVLYHGYKIGVVPNSFVCHDRIQNPKINQEKCINEKIKIKEREYKIQYCNILNDDYPTKYKIKISYLQRQILKSIICLKFYKTNYFVKEYFLLKRIESSVKNSREINIVKGRHYLLNNNLYEK